MRPLRSPSEAIRNLARLGAGVVQRPSREFADRPLDFDRDRVVLLHYEDFEADRLVRGDRLWRRAARRVYHAATVGTTVSGFEVAYRMLVKALQLAGYVVINDLKVARKNPHYPVGLCGYPHVLKHWTLPNPIVLGPGMYDHPDQAPRLFDDPRLQAYVMPCQWMRDLFEASYGPHCPLWFGGLDTENWPDLSATTKDLDLLIYDKIRWDRSGGNTTLTQPILRALDARGVSYEILRYGEYDITQYRALLGRARGMLFLCEHETQGFAYQEAMSSNVPILAWDQGWWLDPVNMPKGAAPVAASSVPYFAPECGETFGDAAAFAEALDRFLERRSTYTPRAFVERELSFAESARRYIEAYGPLARAARNEGR